MPSKKAEEQDKEEVERVQAISPIWFSRTIFGLFFWIMAGICIIYGVRLWFNDPFHPTFIPIAGAAFAAAMAFTLVLTFEYVTGQIKFKFGQSQFEGASGPILLWCVCFVAIVFGLYLLGIADAVTKIKPQADPKPLHDLLF